MTEDAGILNFHKTYEYMRIRDKLLKISGKKLWDFFKRESTLIVRKT